MTNGATIKQFAVKLNISRQFLSNIINHNVEIKAHVKPNPKNKRQHLIDKKGQALIDDYLKNRVRRKYSKSQVPNIKNGLMLKHGLREILKDDENSSDNISAQLKDIKHQLSDFHKNNPIEIQAEYDNTRSKLTRIKTILSRMKPSERLKFVMHPSKFINKLFD